MVIIKNTRRPVVMHPSSSAPESKSSHTSPDNQNSNQDDQMNRDRSSNADKVDNRPARPISQDSSSSETSIIRKGVQARNNIETITISNIKKLKNKVVSRSSLNRSPSPVLNPQEAERLAIQAYQTSQQNHPRPRQKGLEVLTLRGKYVIPSDATFSWLHEVLKKNSETPKGLYKPPKHLLVQDFKLQYIRDFHNQGTLRKFLIPTAGPMEFPVHLESHIQKSLTSTLMSKFSKNSENFESKKSCDAKVKLITALYLKSIKEGQDDVASLLLSTSPAEIADDIENLPFKANLYTRSTVLSYLKAITPSPTSGSNAALTELDIQRIEAFQTVIAHYFRYTDILNLKPAIKDIKTIGQPNLLTNDLLLQNPHIFLEELNTLLKEVIDMKNFNDFESDYTNKARAAGWQAATIYGNAFKYVQEAAKRIEDSQHRIANYIGEAVIVMEAFTGPIAQNTPGSVPASELTKDMVDHIGKTLEIKSVRLKPSLNLTKLVQNLAEGSDLIKAQARAGIIAPGMKSVTAEDLKIFLDRAGIEGRVYKDLGSEFLRVYSQQLQSFAKHYLEHQTSKSIKPLK